MIEMRDEIVRRLKSRFAGADLETTEASEGQFGDLIDVDFLIGSYAGHVAIWSQGSIFYNLFDDARDVDFEIIEEKEATFDPETGTEVATRVVTEIGDAIDRDRAHRSGV